MGKRLTKGLGRKSGGAFRVLLTYGGARHKFVGRIGLREAPPFLGPCERVTLQKRKNKKKEGQIMTQGLEENSRPGKGGCIRTKGEGLT